MQIKRLIKCDCSPLFVLRLISLTSLTKPRMSGQGTLLGEIFGLLFRTQDSVWLCVFTWHFRIDPVSCFRRTSEARLQRWSLLPLAFDRSFPHWWVLKVALWGRLGQSRARQTLRRMFAALLSAESCLCPLLPLSENVLKSVIATFLRVNETKVLLTSQCFCSL